MTVIETMKARGIIPRAALYARFSSDNQREESIDAQLRAILNESDIEDVDIKGQLIPDFMKY